MGREEMMETSKAVPLTPQAMAAMPRIKAAILSRFLHRADEEMGERQKLLQPPPWPASQELQRIYKEVTDWGGQKYAPIQLAEKNFQLKPSAPA